MAEVNLTDDIARLTRLLDLTRGRVPAETAARADHLLTRIDRRQSLAGDITVVALAGATGSGKSSLFNALSRTDLAAAGVQRPMTTQPLAVTFGDRDTSALLDWLQISRRHVAEAGDDMAGLVLLDLADHDSIVTSNRAEVDRLVEVVDAFIWVLDPQKYADQVLHERYLAPLAGHSDVMLFALNQIDRVGPEQTSLIHRDLIDLLHRDGIADPRVFDVSALTGDGVDRLRDAVGQLATAKQAAARRLHADVVDVVSDFAPTLASDPAGTVSRSHTGELVSSLDQVAGVETIGKAVEDSWRRRGAIATGWPVLSWLGKLRQDPLKRLRLDELFGAAKSKEIAPTALTRSALPATTSAAAQARVDQALRSVATDAGAKVPRGWRDTIAKALEDRATNLPDRLDQAVAATDIDVTAKSGWWTFIRVLQWLVLIATVASLLWLGFNAIAESYLGLPELPVFKVGNIPLPTILALGGVLIGFIIAGLSRLGVKAGARLRRAMTERTLSKAVEKVAVDNVIEPVNAELRRHDEALGIVRDLR
ncbi:MAG: 50S ribosome-binding GTPase [Propionibacteriaceae bacterium]|jgi:putative protein kinase ArgK-like GTPase of G3E family|nr:50S ribosome-binding GTPase [Propionibacteriaceae bacterium]